MKPSFDASGLGKVKAWEYALRFVYGGLVTVATGLVAHRWGPVVGGLFLAFPAILPASLTLVKQHDGRKKAKEDATGARYGSVGLLAFGAIVWRWGTAWSAPITLTVAMLAWLAASLFSWWIMHRNDPPS